MWRFPTSPLRPGARISGKSAYGHGTTGETGGRRDVRRRWTYQGHTAPLNPKNLPLGQSNRLIASASGRGYDGGLIAGCRRVDCRYPQLDHFNTP